MNSAITAMHADELHKVNDRIHDRWFSVKDIEFPAQTQDLMLWFSDDPAVDRRSRDSVRETAHVARLLIRRVSSYDLTDREQIIWYDFNRLVYREREGLLEVKTNIPLLLRVRVDALEVQVAAARGPFGSADTQGDEESPTG